jgi:hypothetical protein
LEEVLVFPSTYYMLRSEELLKRKGYALRLVPAPPQAGELCVTAIAVSSSESDEIVRYLEHENILIKAVLPYESRLLRPLAAALEGIASRLSLPAALREVLGGIREGKQLEAAGIAELLFHAEADGSEAVIEAAEAVTRAYFGNRVTAMVGVRVAGRSTPGFLDLPRIEAIAEEMFRLGFVYILLDIGELDEVPWPPQELRKALGDKTIAIIAAASLPAEAGMMVRDHGIRQFLRYGNDIFGLDARGLADEIIFLRDNLPGPVGSGNLLPLLSPDLVVGDDGGAQRVRAVLAACRLVLGDVFLPAPPSLWRAGKPSGANMWVLDATGRPLSKAAEEAEMHLREMGLAFTRVGRVGGRSEAPTD